MTQILPTPDELARRITDGASVAIAKEPLSPLALAHALIRRDASRHVERLEQLRFLEQGYRIRVGRVASAAPGSATFGLI